MYYIPVLSILHKFSPLFSIQLNIFLICLKYFLPPIFLQKRRSDWVHALSCADYPIECTHYPQAATNDLERPMSSVSVGGITGVRELLREVGGRLIINIEYYSGKHP